MTIRCRVPVSWDLRHSAALNPEASPSTSAASGTRAPLGVHRQQALPPGIAPGARAAGRLQALARLHRAHSTDPLRQQPGLVVETRRVHQAAGAFQGHRQAPAFAAHQRRRAAPAQAQTLGKKHAPRSADLLQPEARDALAARRQIAHPALQPQGATIQLGGQPAVQRPLAPIGRPRRTRAGTTPRSTAGRTVNNRGKAHSARSSSTQPDGSAGSKRRASSPGARAGTSLQVATTLSPSATEASHDYRSDRPTAVTHGHSWQRMTVA